MAADFVVPESFVFERVGEHRYRFDAVAGADPGYVIFGGQLLAQMLLASAASVPAKALKSIQALFVRGGDVSEAVDIELEPLHDGRSFASVNVAVRQSERLCATALVLLHAPEDDGIRHVPPMPDIEGPERAVRLGPPGLVAPGAEYRVVGGIDLWGEGDETGPPELSVWVRWPPNRAPLALNQAMLAFATDGFLIGTAMRPHEGVGQHLAHARVATGVLSHAVYFHDPVPSGEWLLLAQASPFAGGARALGEGRVFREDGRLVATFVQESLIR
jgi:acyl-CoA thioesterase